MPFYGKYRAMVVDVKDPEKRGRVRVTCPKVYGENKSPWCQPCSPYAYEKGGDFVLPKLNDFIWVEFEEGNSAKPLYIGGLWAKDSSPIANYDEDAIKERQLEFLGCKIIMKEKYLIITNGQVKIELTEGDMKITADGAIFSLEKGKAKLTAERIDFN